MVEEDINPNELIIVSYKAFKRRGLYHCCNMSGLMLTGL
jgi:hypothetical protein